MPQALITHKGQCHCAGVKFEVDYGQTALVQECNCSICKLSGFQHLIVPRAQFRLLEGGELLTDYRFNSEVARHTFCKVCGIKAFYVPRSNPDGYSVNFRCLDASKFSKFILEPFDGINWEDNAGRLSHLSNPVNPE